MTAIFTKMTPMNIHHHKLMNIQYSSSQTDDDNDADYMLLT